MTDGWLKVADVDLSLDLSGLVGLLSSQRYLYRVTEERGRQVVWVQNASLIPSLQQVIEKLERGELNLKSQPEPLQPNNMTKSNITARFMSYPITAILLLFSALGFLTVEMNWWQIYGWIIFLQPQGAHLLSFEETLLGGQLWRLWTPMFIHSGIFHIVFNSLLVWDMGRRLERLKGPYCYVAYVLFLSLMSNLTQYYWEDNANFGGMSGVIYGFLGYFVVCEKFLPNPLLDISNGIVVFMLVWLCICLSGFIDLFMSGGVANGAHLGGLLAGVLLGLFTCRKTVMNQLLSPREYH